MPPTVLASLIRMVRPGATHSAIVTAVLAIPCSSAVGGGIIDPAIQNGPAGSLGTGAGDLGSANHPRIPSTPSDDESDLGGPVQPSVPSLSATPRPLRVGTPFLGRRTDTAVETPPPTPESGRNGVGKIDRPLSRQGGTVGPAPEGHRPRA